ncbi:MAG: aldo/keto reductase [Leptospirales bacterium]|jgi:predicted oxidoreductase
MQNPIVPKILMAPQGPEVSRFAYGVWRILDDPQGAAPATVLKKIDACLELGITTFDHADIYGGYGCEEAFGAALKERPGLKDGIEIVTKCDIMLTDPARPNNRVKHYDTSAAHIQSSAERSLKNLNVDRIDVLLLHRPDPLMDANETAGALSALRESGKIRYAGVSNFAPAQFDLLQSRLNFPLVTNQIEINPMRLDSFLDGSLDQCQRLRMSPMAWSPSAGGAIFTGKSEQATRVRACLEKLAGARDTSPDVILYAWLNLHPANIVTVLGTNQIERIQSAARSFAVTLDRQEWFEVWSASTGAEVP